MSAIYHHSPWYVYVGSVYHIAYFMTYFRRLCFARVCSYNRDTCCSEAWPLFKDGRATHLAKVV